MNLPLVISIHNILAFKEYLYTTSISPKVIKNYLSSIASMATSFSWDHSALSSHHVPYISISINSKLAPTPRGIFDVKTMYYTLPPVKVQAIRKTTIWGLIILFYIITTNTLYFIYICKIH